MYSQAVTVEEMTAIDVNSEYLGASRLVLMENAGAEVARAIREKMEVKNKKVVVVSHLGNKGGDGFVTARHLAILGADVTVVLIGDPLKIRSAEARKNWSILKEMESSVKIIVIKDSSKLHLLEEVLKNANLVVDALLGTGVKGELRPPISNIVKLINEARKTGAFTVAIDLPTGIHPNTGEVLGVAVEAHLTVTHHKPKIGLLSEKSRKYVGELRVANIGIPPEAELFAGPGDVLIALKERKPTAHKGDFGRIVIIGGSKDYSGAPALAGLAALRAGADLSIIIAPKAISTSIRSYSPNLIVREYEGDYLNSSGVELALKEGKRANALIIGPGLSINEQVEDAVHKILEEFKKLNIPVVVDADAIKACATKIDSLHNLKGVITPHVGEFKTLTQIQLPPEDKGGWKNRIDIVRREAEKLKTTILLKAHYDIISNGVKVKVNRTGNPGMTVGGTGDVLAGLTAAFLAWNTTPMRAATAAAFINGLAGDLAVNEKGYHILASDVIEKIPDAFAKVKEYITK
ncbi:MAG: bifunctional ADP-dependent NAD(P)H-hydrate dehydratase/NAD(P)H-hydrate epimerase [Candidatus Methanomethylicota archaeon]|uniref:Bifunctional NAD(P)H-hydrate repair enzyme n=1 Tax=Thermoproteota archaeon TaxID=2056631 RepID=A0A497F7D5_9CREN|nr:MAG: bifunctional ADP-dependent NAD(P)H-hydrate dehydratase/NAD(P)H-hydrate epimerase [Candidatus Verstraetearchaeota archaeon]